MAKESFAAGGVRDVNAVFQEVLKMALIHDSLACVICDAVLDKRQDHLCVLASNRDGPAYVKLVGELRAEHQSSTMKAEDKEPGEWVGLRYMGTEGQPRKVVGCICARVRSYDKESQVKGVTKE
ncbi:40S ribosomal protein S12-like [Microtus oregoni]|uniref:40S ribosomal protein S12-like n=1 Tax=Microtus oregoni TaxID=111838 RepID=UPI001BB2512D|nr:40S ribosomal protein S12-like [Microtus oregoni]